MPASVTGSVSLSKPGSEPDQHCLTNDTDDILLDLVYDFAKAYLSLDIPWIQICEQMEQHLGKSLNVWAVMSRYHQLNFHFCIIQSLCQVEEFKWNSEACEVLAHNSSWQSLIKKEPSFAVMKGFRFPSYDKLHRIYSLKRIHDDNGTGQTPRSSRHRTLEVPLENKRISSKDSLNSDQKITKRNARNGSRYSRPSNNDKAENLIKWTLEKDRILIKQVSLQFLKNGKTSTWNRILKNWCESFRIRSKGSAVYERYYLLRNTYLAIIQLIKIPGFLWNDESCTLMHSEKLDHLRVRDELSDRNKFSDALNWIFDFLDHDSFFEFPLFKEIETLLHIISQSQKRNQSFSEANQERTIAKKPRKETNFKGYSSSWNEKIENAMLLKIIDSYQDDCSSIDWHHIADELQKEFNLFFSEKFLRQKFTFLHRKYQLWRKIQAIDGVDWDANQYRIIASDEVWEELKSDNSQIQLYCMFRYSTFPLASQLHILFGHDESEPNSDSEEV